jgi:hypothetical protein
MCDIDGQPSCMTERVRTARKSHRCCECDEPIHAGEKYHFLSGVWEGQGDSFKSHVLCDELRQWMHAEHKRREDAYDIASRACNRATGVDFRAAKRAFDVAFKALVPCGPCLRGLQASIAEWADEGFDVYAMDGSPVNAATRQNEFSCQSLDDGAEEIHNGDAQNG